MKNFTIKSNIRLPFEPKKDALKLKNEIRESLNHLESEENNILYAYFMTNKTDFFDVENVLFYNVGSGAFNKLSIGELCFELKFDSRINDYEYFYGLLEQTPFSFDTDKVLCSVETELPKISSSYKPVDYWTLMHRGNLLEVKDCRLETNFALDIELGLTEKHKNIVALIKPLIDGIISSLHFQDNVSENVIEYISNKLNMQPETIKEMFASKSYSILGKRDLVSEYRNGIKWNPEDERCTKVRVRQYRKDKNMLKVSVYKI